MPTRETIEALIRILAAAEDLDPDLVVRQCEQESQFNPAARNKNSGAFGLFQLMPATAVDIGVNRNRWHENVFGGIKYDGRLFRAYKNDYAKMLAAYNWGPGNLDDCIDEYGTAWRDHLPTETSNYLDVILPK